MSDQSANLSLPLLQPSQAQKHVTHNEALLILDAVVQLAVVSRTETTPPTDPGEGVRYIVAPGAVGAWAGQETALALYRAGSWMFIPPQEGWTAYVADQGATVRWQGGAWQGAEFDNLPGVGINASADGINRLAVSSQATLLTHDGADHQLKINKAQASDTASLLFQTGFSGRAEMGIAGTDAFALKVSADGATWATALAAAASGAVDLAAGSTVDGQTSYHRGNLLGPVSQAAGVPQGAVIERGSTAEGDYVRFADGTQICTADMAVDIDTGLGALFTSGPVAVNFPMPFAETPMGGGAMANTTQAWVNGRAGSATGWSASAFAPLARTGDVMHLTAIGRWF